MRVKSILVSQPKPTTDSSPYFDLSKKQKVTVDFRPFIHIEGLSAKDIRQQKVDLAKFTAVVRCLRFKTREGLLTI